MAINVNPDAEEQKARSPGVFDQAFLTGVAGVTELLLLRHAQQEIDLHGATVGDWIDPPLSGQGRQQEFRTTEDVRGPERDLCVSFRCRAHWGHGRPTGDLVSGGCPLLRGGDTGWSRFRGVRAARVRATPEPGQLVSQRGWSSRARSSSISSTRRLMVRVGSLPRSRP